MGLILTLALTHVVASVIAFRRGRDKGRDEMAGRKR